MADVYLKDNVNGVSGSKFPTSKAESVVDLGISCSQEEPVVVDATAPAIVEK